MNRWCASLLALLVATISLSAADVPLVDAAKRGDAAAVRTLIQQRADVNSAEPDGTTALHWAVQRDSVDVVDLLIRAGANAKAVNRYGVTPLSVAATNGNGVIIQKLIAAGADPKAISTQGETPLMTAARTGKVDAVKTLLASGVDVNATEKTRGQTALMWAAAENHAATVSALIAAGADINLRSTGGFTPLLFAVRAGAIDTVKVLLAAGASANDTIQPGGRPAMAAAGRGGPATAPASQATGRGGRAGAPPAGGQGTDGRGRGAAVADPPADRSASATTERSAAEAAEIRQLLAIFNTGSRRSGGSGITNALILAITNAHFELAALLLEQGADPNADGAGWTALHQLAWTRRPPIQHGLPPPVPTGNLDSLELARKLLEKRANPNARMTREPADGARNILNRVGSTPFLQAAKLGDLEYMRLLVAHGADASITTEEGATPMMAAAGVGIWQIGESAGSNEEAFEAVKLCFELGNDVNVVDANGNTALHGAAHRGANQVVQFLVSKGARMDVPNRLGWTPWIIADGVFYPNTYNRRLDTAELLLKLGANPKVGTRRPEDLPPSESKLNKPAADLRQ
jgi:ankyrin repeat protein